MTRKPSDQPNTDLLPAGYDDLLRELKQRIRTAQVRATLAVNHELVLLYWGIGRDILQQAEQGWGAKVIARLYERQGKALTNFDRVLPVPQSD